MCSCPPASRSCPPVPIAVPNPSLALLFDVGGCRLELAGVDVNTWLTTDVKVSSLQDRAGKPHTNHQASLRATLSLALLIMAFAFALNLARFSFRWAFRS